MEKQKKEHESTFDSCPDGVSDNLRDLAMHGRRWGAL